MSKRKVYIQLEDSTESIWVEESDDDFIILNVPFFANGLSFGDLICTKEQSGRLYYYKTIQKSGHSTYRFFCLSEDIDQVDFFLSTLTSLGCTYEKGTKFLYAVDVPPDSDIYAVYDILELGEKRGIWEFEEADCSHPSITKSTT